MSKDDGRMMHPNEITDEGVWESDFGDLPLLGLKIPLVESVQNGKSHEEVLFLVQATDWFDICPATNCHSYTIGGILLVTESAILFPTRCCNQMCWIRKGDVDNVMGTE